MDKLYLYDIQNIKKETRYPSWTKSSDGQKPASSKMDCNTDTEKSKSIICWVNNE